MLSCGVLTHINKRKLIILWSGRLIKVLNLLVNTHNWRHLSLDLIWIHCFLKHKAILLWNRHAKRVHRISTSHTAIIKGTLLLNRPVFITSALYKIVPYLLFAPFLLLRRTRVNHFCPIFLRVLLRFFVVGLWFRTVIWILKAWYVFLGGFIIFEYRWLLRHWLTHFLIKNTTFSFWWLNFGSLNVLWRQRLALRIKIVT